MKNLTSTKQSDAAQVVVWALRQGPEQETRSLINQSESGVTVRLFGAVPGSKTGQVTIKISKRDALVMLASPFSARDVEEVVQGVLPFIECPTVMLSTNHD
jgi:hypothetical protein